MITPIALTEKLLFTTVRLQSILQSGDKAVGTGFIFNFPLDSERIMPAIITNKHVIAGAEKVVFQLHESVEKDNQQTPSGTFFPISLSTSLNPWFFHPDPDIDLCAVPLQP